MAFRHLVVLALYQVVSGRFAWLDTRMPPANQVRSPPGDDLFRGLLGDMNLDISFNGGPRGDNTPHELLLDDSPSSMFSALPSMFRGPSLGPRFPRRPAAQSPLFLIMHSLQDTMDAPVESRSVFRLQQTDRVTGDTVRFTMRSHGDDRQLTRESWSAPPQTQSPKLFLCAQADCGEDDGVELMSVLGGLNGLLGGGNYMHLVPTTPAPVEWLQQLRDDEDTEDEDAALSSWMDMALNTMRGCHRGVTRWYFGDEGEDEPQDVVIVSQVQLEEGGMTSSEAEQVGQEELMLMGMSMLLLSVAMCGVVYAVLSCLVYRRKTACRTEGYVAMHETDAF